MAKTANCPSCGAPVSFKAAASAYAICEFCHSTLVRQDEGVKNIGRMADLLDDDSPIQIGSEGRLRALHFAVIGRIQLKYAAGFWNEWHILLDDGRSAWLSEAGGQYTITQLLAVSEPIPQFHELNPGSNVTLRGRQFTVNDLTTARCIAGAGELPFKVEAGYDVNAADLRSEHHFASIDYSETPPLVFVGEAVALADLKMNNLRDTGTVGAAGPTLGKGMVKSFACPKCGAPLTVHAKQIEVVVCPSCGVSVDANDPNYRIIAAAAQAAISARVEPLLPLGTRGRFAGSEWEVIGFVRRQSVVDGMPYRWSEYLLHERVAGFAWLVEYNGHWNFVRTIDGIPKTGPTGPHGEAAAAWWQNESFKHFQSAIAEVIYVVGEFYWKVEVGEKVRVHDYVAPPCMLSEERGDNESAWSLGVYAEPDEVWQAFKLKDAPPPRIGIGACQPNAHAAAHKRTCALFWQLSAVALIMQLGFILLFGGATVFNDTLVFHSGDNEAVHTAAFTLAKPAKNLYLLNHTDLDNAWLQLNMTLVNQQSGETYGASRELSRYHGVDGGESWSEGDRDDSVSLGAVPAGTYYLAIDAEAAPDLRQTVADRIRVVRDKAGWINWVLLQIFLAAFPLVSRWRVASFESRRWADSDHPPGDTSAAASDD